MTNAAGLDANAHLSLTRRSDGPLHEVKSPGFRYFDRPIRFSHLRLLSIWKNSYISSFTELRTSGRLKIRRCSRTWLNYASPIVLEFPILVLIESAAVWRFCWALVGGKREYDLHFSSGVGRVNAFGIGAF